eukprot:15472462-Alexandrium_andersonii.AAC.1
MAVRATPCAYALYAQRAQTLIRARAKYTVHIEMRAQIAECTARNARTHRTRNVRQAGTHARTRSHA